MSAALPQFAWDSLFDALHLSLWPAEADPAEVESAWNEPRSLFDRIETLTRDSERWLTPDHTGSSNSRNSAADPDREPGPQSIRYISLAAHPDLAVEKLATELDWRGDAASFVIRHEYVLFMKHAMARISSPPDDSYRGRFFVTGQSGIGKSLGCYYLLFRLLATGQSVFFLNSSSNVYYFSRDGVQRASEVSEAWPRMVEALRNSWVLIDVDDKPNWMPPSIFNRAHCIVWTASESDGTRRFVKTFGAEKWYMKGWSSTEIEALTERLSVKRKRVAERLAMGGPVARSLFGGVPIPTRESMETDIQAALRDNIFAFDSGDSPIFIIQPRVSTNGLQRTDYAAEFVSDRIAHLTFDIAQDHLERIQGQLGAALDAPSTSTVAGEFLEGMIHRALNRGVRLPVIFGAGTLAGTFPLDDIQSGTPAASESAAAKRPLYLRPTSANFAILATDDKLGFVHCASGGGDYFTHRRDIFRTLLRIVTRLPRGMRRSEMPVVYCVVGTQHARVRALVGEAKRRLEELKGLEARELGEEMYVREADAEEARRRIGMFGVVGYTFHYRLGFVEVSE
ncbi:hypothetical protein FB45DRAFT_1130 [Roridomyces roridus]|uniref:Uncharacterized protein n=1 Tax=Roridomyces roridus TaxID=1738132 RepID=A0AAD7CI24_9AGAR|nr:hypothetical protein FB45DRAFT_1130 [Roridomyces roridus]